MAMKVTLPCKIGQPAWGVSAYNKALKARLGVVSEMVFNSDMELVITVQGISRGRWGEAVFATEDEANKAIANGKVKREPKVTPKQYATRDTLCWECKKSGGLCTWSSFDAPVKGWNAKATTAGAYMGNPTRSYLVISCPEFEEG